MTDDYKTCPECGGQGNETASFLGHDGKDTIMTTYYYCGQWHRWSHRRSVTCKLNPEFQKQLWEAIRPDLCPFCRQPLDNGRELFGTVCHKECRDSERAIRGIE